MADLPADVLEALREQGRKFGKLGGLARAKNMTAKQRRESALKASRAAAAARTRKAKERKKAEE